MPTPSNKIPLQQRLIERWWRPEPPPHLLRLLAALYCAAVAVRRAGYRHALLPVRRVAVPVVIVGNLTVGGSGKTPLIIWLAQQLQKRGFHPGVVARGYQGQATSWPRRVTAQSDPREVGDEPVLIAQRSGCPVVVGPDRVAACEQLLAEARCDLLLADDGLQHYRLHRNVEILVIDGERRFGNGYCLPAGPLREPPNRRREVDLVVMNGGPATAPDEWSMQLRADSARQLLPPYVQRPLSTFHEPLHAVAGIGHPERFFTQLERAGLRIIRHPLPDHYPLTAGELEFGEGKEVLMTEKDGVKYRPFATPHHWVVPVEAELKEGLVDAITHRCREGESDG